MNIDHRDNLPRLLDELNLTNIGVEIGVASGAYSHTILTRSNLKLLYSVDSWVGIEKIKESAVKRLSVFGDRNKILHMTSKEASKLFKDNSLDFIYIDADHVYESVKHDIGLWYQKVKVGGIFAGHDYVNRNNKYGKFGVIKAVNEMREKYKQKVFTTRDHSPSWYIIKK